MNRYRLAKLSPAEFKRELQTSSDRRGKIEEIVAELQRVSVRASPPTLAQVEFAAKMIFTKRTTVQAALKGRALTRSSASRIIEELTRRG